MKGGSTVPKLDVLNVSGQKVSEIELNASVFGIEPNIPVMHEVVKNYLANQRHFYPLGNIEQIAESSGSIYIGEGLATMWAVKAMMPGEPVV